MTQYQSPRSESWSSKPPFDVSDKKIPDTIDCACYQFIFNRHFSKRSIEINSNRRRRPSSSSPSAPSCLTGHSKRETNSTYQSLKTYLRFNFPASLLGCSAGPQSRCDAQLQTVVNCGPVRLCVLSTCPQDTLVIGTYIAAGGQRKIFPAVWLVCSEKHSLSVCDRPEVLAAAALLLQGGCFRFEQTAAMFLPRGKKSENKPLRTGERYDRHPNWDRHAL